MQPNETKFFHFTHFIKKLVYFNFSVITLVVKIYQSVTKDSNNLQLL